MIAGAHFAGDPERVLIAAWRALGVNEYEIAEMLNAEGAPVPPGGARWTGYLVKAFANGWGGVA